MKDAAIEILVFKPDPVVPPDNREVKENPRLNQRYKQCVSVGVYLEGSNLKYYFFDDLKVTDRPPKTYDSLVELKVDLPEGLRTLFDNKPRLYLMGHANGGYYGLANIHGESEIIHDDDFDQVIEHFRQALPPAHGDVSVILEACNTDNQADADKSGQAHPFLQRVSAKAEHHDITFSGTGPWDPYDQTTGFRGTPKEPLVMSLGGGVWKHGNSVLFYHEDIQVAVRKSIFACTQTAKAMKTNTVSFARTILGKSADVTLIERIALGRDILQNERFLVDGVYPDKAKELTARHVLSHTTGLPNFGSGSSSSLIFSSESALGEGYAYSGEAFFYLQQVIETKIGKKLEDLAKEYIFGPLEMVNSTFMPPSEEDGNFVAVHTELGRPEEIYVGDPPSNGAGSLLTTGEDFSKFMAAWLENMDDPLIQQAFNPTSKDDFMTCGLGWHIYRNEGQVIAYQYGENLNTRAFVAINLTEKKAAAFFTNSENGMSIADKILTSPELLPIGNMKALFEHLHYTQCDEPGWQETISGRIAEVEGRFDEARSLFERAIELDPEDESKRLRLQWFDKVHEYTKVSIPAAAPLSTFVGTYKNPYNDEVKISTSDDGLVFKQFDKEIKLVRVSETEFLPETDQSIKVTIDDGQMSIQYLQGYEKTLSKQPDLGLQAEYKEAIRTLRESHQDTQASTDMPKESPKGP